jgi:hypothetical protein
MPDTPADDAHHQHQQHARAPDDLEQIEGAGALSCAPPGSTEAALFDLAMADELDTLDAEMLARDGPDALTSDRAYRMAQFRAAQAAARGDAD